MCDMPPDSLPIIACAVVLFAASLAAFVLAARLKTDQRHYIRFAAGLFAALAIAAPWPAIAEAAALVVLPAASAALTLAVLARFAGRIPALPAASGLAIPLVAGLGAMLIAAPMLSAVPVTLAAITIAAVALRRLAFMAALSGMALSGAILGFLSQGCGAGLLLFSAASLLGLSRSALAVEQPADARFVISVRLTG